MTGSPGRKTRQVVWSASLVFSDAQADQSRCSMSNQMEVLRPIRSSAGVEPVADIGVVQSPRRQRVNFSTGVSGLSFFVSIDSLMVLTPRLNSP